jgi:hypothetical protein
VWFVVKNPACRKLSPWAEIWWIHLSSVNWTMTHHPPHALKSRLERVEDDEAVDESFQWFHRTTGE